MQSRLPDWCEQCTLFRRILDSNWGGNHCQVESPICINRCSQQRRKEADIGIAKPPPRKKLKSLPPEKVIDYYDSQDSQDYGMENPPPRKKLNFLPSNKDRDDDDDNNDSEDDGSNGSDDSDDDSNDDKNDEDFKRRLRRDSYPDNFTGVVRTRFYSLRSGTLNVDKLNGNGNDGVGKTVYKKRKYKKKMADKYGTAMEEYMGSNPMASSLDVLAHVRNVLFGGDDNSEVPEDYPGDDRIKRKVGDLRRKLKISPRRHYEFIPEKYVNRVRRVVEKNPFKSAEALFDQVRAGYFDIDGNEGPDDWPGDSRMLKKVKHFQPIAVPVDIDAKYTAEIEKQIAEKPGTSAAYILERVRTAFDGKNGMLKDWPGDQRVKDRAYDTMRKKAVTAARKKKKKPNNTNAEKRTSTNDANMGMDMADKYYHEIGKHLTISPPPSVGEIVMQVRNIFSDDTSGEMPGDWPGDAAIAAMARRQLTILNSNGKNYRPFPDEYRWEIEHMLDNGTNATSKEVHERLEDIYRDEDAGEKGYGSMPRDWPDEATFRRKVNDTKKRRRLTMVGNTE